MVWREGETMQMRPPSYRTGKAHQEKAIQWVNRRLVTTSGRRFLAGPREQRTDQDGVLLADSVGMGKTWEALGAAVLILYSKDLQKRLGRVLVICPPNLVTKWEDELAKGAGFRVRLETWARKRGTLTARQIRRTLEQVVPVRRSEHVKTRKKRGKMKVPSGTYIVSAGLLTRQGVGLAALRREAWDVVIVDEAHHNYVRKALEALQVKRRCEHKLLLTATPFQLEPREWNDLGRHLVRHGTKILSQPKVRKFVDRLADAFENQGDPGPTKAQRQDAEELLSKIAVRTVPRFSSRQYFLLGLNGEESQLHHGLDTFNERSVQELFGERSFASSADVQRFECAYLDRRFRLASEENPTFVATELRRFLATGLRGKAPAPSPRLTALRKWARRVWLEDIERALIDGYPRKTIVFTSWVGGPGDGEAANLQRMLAQVFEEAMAMAKRRRPIKWKRWCVRGQRALARLRPDDLAPLGPRWVRKMQDVEDRLKYFSNNELLTVFAGANKRFARAMRAELRAIVERVHEAYKKYQEIESKRSLEGRGALRRVNDAFAALAGWTGAAKLPAVERYTGRENRRERDRAADGFRSVCMPWALVASNVGAEGIDLHTYTRRIVHYDLEWNPAKMEQREGRGDRVGRKLKDPISILFCLVPRTYDERMFHQLIARDRWHGILLGKAAARLAKDEGRADARMERIEVLKKLRLDLSP